MSSNTHTPGNTTPASEYKETDLLGRPQQSASVPAMEKGYGQYGQYGQYGSESKRSCIPASKNKRRLLFFGVPIALVIIAGIVVGAVVGTSKSNQKSSGSSGKGSDGNGSDSDGTAVVAASNGTSGSNITMSNGKSFTYINDFGGSWAVNPSDPYSVSGQAQSWSPSLLEEWKWGEDIIRG